VRESSRTERGVSVTGHFGEGLVELVGDGLELLLLMHELIFVERSRMYPIAKERSVRASKTT
jgi:hypothetical protein